MSAKSSKVSTHSLPPQLIKKTASKSTLVEDDLVLPDIADSASRSTSLPVSSGSKSAASMRSVGEQSDLDREDEMRRRQLERVLDEKVRQLEAVEAEKRRKRTVGKSNEDELKRKLFAEALGRKIRTINRFRINNKVVETDGLETEHLESEVEVKQPEVENEDESETSDSESEAETEQPQNETADKKKSISFGGQEILEDETTSKRVSSSLPPPYSKNVVYVRHQEPKRHRKTRPGYSPPNTAVYVSRFKRFFLRRDLPSNMAAHQLSMMSAYQQQTNSLMQHRGGLDFYTLARGSEKAYSTSFLVNLDPDLLTLCSREDATTLDLARDALIAHTKRIFKFIVMKSGRELNQFCFGSTNVQLNPNYRRFDKMDPMTWKKEGKTKLKLALDIYVHIY